LHLNYATWSRAAGRLHRIHAWSAGRAHLDNARRLRAGCPAGRRLVLRAGWAFQRRLLIAVPLERFRDDGFYGSSEVASLGSVMAHLLQELYCRWLWEAMVSAPRPRPVTPTIL